MSSSLTGISFQSAATFSFIEEISGGSPIAGIHHGGIVAAGGPIIYPVAGNIGFLAGIPRQGDLGGVCHRRQRAEQGEDQQREKQPHLKFFKNKPVRHLTPF